MNATAFLILLAGAAVIVALKLWSRNETLMSDLEYKDVIIARYADEAQLYAAQRALCFSAADGGMPELVDHTDPRCTPLYRSVLTQRQLVEEFELLATNRGATYHERVAVRNRVATAVRRVIDRC